jgi:hypothetical protein
MEAAAVAASASIPQCMEALARANEVRYARAELKRNIEAGREDPATVLESCPWQVESMTVGELLRSQRRWGRTRAHKFLVPFAVPENRTIGRLTERQRRILAHALAAKRRPQRVI